MQWFKRKTRVTVSPTDYQSPALTGGTIVRKRNCCQRCCTKETLKEQALLLATIVSVILGVAVGIGLRELKCPTGTTITQRFMKLNKLFSSRSTHQWMSNYERRYHIHRFSGKDFYQYSQNAHLAFDCFKYHFIVSTTRCTIFGQNGSSSLDLLHRHNVNRGYFGHYSCLGHSTGFTWQFSRDQSRSEIGRRSYSRYHLGLIQVRKVFRVLLFSLFQVTI